MGVSENEESLARSLLEGMLAIRDEKREYQESLEGSDRPDVSFKEISIKVDEAIDQSDLSREDASEEEWGHAQEFLRQRGFVSLEGEASNSEIYASMTFSSEPDVERARDFLEES